MKLKILPLILILALLVSKPTQAISQSKLPTGLYRLNDNGTYPLTLNGKTYHADATPLALLKDMNNFSVTKERTAKDYYTLNIELDAEAAQGMKSITFDYGQTAYIGLIISGKLVSAPRITGQASTGKVSIGSKSKPELEQISDHLKAEKAKK